MSRYTKPTQSVPSELLLLYVFTINRKEKSREEPLGETKNREVQHKRMCIMLHQYVSTTNRIKEKPSTP